MLVVICNYCLVFCVATWLQLGVVH